MSAKSVFVSVALLALQATAAPLAVLGPQDGTGPEVQRVKTATSIAHDAVQKMETTYHAAQSGDTTAQGHINHAFGNNPNMEAIGGHIDLLKTKKYRMDKAQSDFYGAGAYDPNTNLVHYGGAFHSQHTTDAERAGHVLHESSHAILKTKDVFDKHGNPLDKTRADRAAGEHSGYKDSGLHDIKNKPGFSQNMHHNADSWRVFGERVGCGTIARRWLDERAAEETDVYKREMILQVRNACAYNPGARKATASSKNDHGKHQTSGKHTNSASHSTSRNSASHTTHEKTGGHSNHATTGSRTPQKKSRVNTSRNPSRGSTHKIAQHATPGRTTNSQARKPSRGSSRSATHPTGTGSRGRSSARTGMTKKQSASRKASNSRGSTRSSNAKQSTRRPSTSSSRSTIGKHTSNSKVSKHSSMSTAKHTTSSRSGNRSSRSASKHSNASGSKAKHGANRSSSSAAKHSSTRGSSSRSKSPSSSRSKSTSSASRNKSSSSRRKSSSSSSRSKSSSSSHKSSGAAKKVTSKVASVAKSAFKKLIKKH